MNILEEFWYGNIEPAEYDICNQLGDLINRYTDHIICSIISV